MGKIFAFVSYAHDDDVFDGGAISYLAQKIELSLGASPRLSKPDQIQRGERYR